MSNSNRNATVLFEKLHEFVRDYDADGQASLFSESGVWELPFASGNIPKRIEGRENILRFGKAGMENSKAKGRRILGYDSLTIHESKSQNIIFAEFVLEGELVATGSRYRIPYIQKLISKDGQIVLFRDYFSMDSLKGVLE